MKPSIRLRIIDHEGRGSELLSAELSEAIFRSLSYDEHSEQWLLTMAIVSAKQGDKADLENIMKEHGFSEVCTRLIVHEIAGTSAGRPFKYSLRRVQVQMVAEARSGLRAKGTRGKVLQRALDEAEARYKVWAKNMRANVPGLRPPAFDRKYIRNYLKRPKRRP